jgi:hypothetical protein
MSAISKSGLTQPKCFEASDLEMELRGLFHPNHSVVSPYIQLSKAVEQFTLKPVYLVDGDLLPIRH